MSAAIAVREARPDDFDQWLPLWDGYNAFYERAGPTAVSDAMTRTTWGRFFARVLTIWAAPALATIAALSVFRPSMGAYTISFVALCVSYAVSPAVAAGSLIGAMITKDPRRRDRFGDYAAASACSAAKNCPAFSRNSKRLMKVMN